MDPRVLSMLAQVLITIQSRLRRMGHERASYVYLDDTKVRLRRDCAIFITLNPGYAGRVELPMNLKALFRQVAMVAPDNEFITEILLRSAGFIGAVQLARKIVLI
jgi:dynein heavy chain